MYSKSLVRTQSKVKKKKTETDKPPIYNLDLYKIKYN